MEHFRAQFLFPGTAATGRPVKSWVADRTGFGEVRQLRQYPRQDCFVARTVMGCPEGTTDGVIDEHRARRRNLAHNVEGGAGHQRWNAVIFDNMGNETDGLMTKGSIGNKQCEVNFGVFQLPGDGRGKLGFDFFLTPDTAHD